MQRTLYLATLVLLQIALIAWIAPPLAQALSFDAAPGLAPGGWPATLQLLATAATIVGASVALAFPALALTRSPAERPVAFRRLAPGGQPRSLRARLPRCAPLPSRSRSFPCCRWTPG